MKLTFHLKRPETDNCVSFIFTADQEFSWQAGQSIKLELPGDYGPIEHRFSISSAPYEQRVMITTRLSLSPFKKALAALKPGDIIDANAIEGDFIWRENNWPRVFIVAGIGITPVHSILKERFHQQLPMPATLLYGSANDHIIFKSEIEQWQKAHPELNVIYIVGRHIDGGLILQHIPGIANNLVYVSGPSSMVDTISQDLLGPLKVPEAQLVRDWFTGYHAGHS